MGNKEYPSVTTVLFRTRPISSWLALHRWLYCNTCFFFSLSYQQQILPTLFSWSLHSHSICFLYSLLDSCADGKVSRLRAWAWANMRRVVWLQPRGDLNFMHSSSSIVWMAKCPAKWFVTWTTRPTLLPSSMYWSSVSLSLWCLRCYYYLACHCRHFSIIFFFSSSSSSSLEWPWTKASVAKYVSSGPIDKRHKTARMHCAG